MNLTDRFGNPVSCRNRIALDLYDQAVTQLNFYRTDPIATIDEALAIDPAFVMGHCFKAGLLATTTEKGCEAGIAAALEAAERHVGHALERERMHLNAARAWLSRDFAGAAKLYGDICAEYPRDLLALQIAHLFDFFLGHSTMLRDRPAQVLHAWGERDPQRGIVLGMHSFGLEECGAYDDAEAIGRRAIELSPADVWAAHAVTHVLEMRGQTHSGIEWIKNTAAGLERTQLLRLPQLVASGALSPRRGGLRCGARGVRHAHASHVHAGRGRNDRCLRAALETSAAQRRRRRSLDRARPELGAVRATTATTPSMTCMRSWPSWPPAISGRCSAFSTDSGPRHAVPDTNGIMSRDVGLPIARALCAFERQDFEVAIDELQRVRPFAHRFGGSHAQRDSAAAHHHRSGVSGGPAITGPSAGWRTAGAQVAQRIQSQPV